MKAISIQRWILAVVSFALFCFSSLSIMENFDNDRAIVQGMAEGSERYNEMTGQSGKSYALSYVKIDESEYRLWGPPQDHSIKDDYLEAVYQTYEFDGSGYVVSGERTFSFPILEESEAFFVMLGAAGLVGAPFLLITFGYTLCLKGFMARKRGSRPCRDKFGLVAVIFVFAAVVGGIAVANIGISENLADPSILYGLVVYSLIVGLSWRTEMEKPRVDESLGKAVYYMFFLIALCLALLPFILVMIHDDLMPSETETLLMGLSAYLYAAMALVTGIAFASIELGKGRQKKPRM